MARTVNGISVSEAMERLSVKRNPDKKLMNKYPYYKIETFYERINSVFGVDHYNVEYFDYAHTVVESGQELLSCKCRVTLLDDNYEPFLVKEALGGKEIQYEKETGRDSGLKNLPANCMHVAFKEVWKSLGIFGMRQDEESPQNGADSNTNGNSNTSNNGTNGKSQTVSNKYVLENSGKLVFVREDTNTKQPIYRLPCVDSATKAKVDVIFYPNRYKNYNQKIVGLKNAKEEDRFRFTIEATKSSPRDGVGQLIFSSFVS